MAWSCASSALIAAEDDQPSHWANLQIPPAPVLAPSAAIKSFKLQSGYRIELVAAEPMVQDPVAISWDGDGRMYVCEMRGYMPDVAGKDEDKPTGRISLLTDTNGDGVMDKSTVFVDGLIMPRAVMCINGGVLIAEPPVVWFCKDTNGDGQADVKEKVIDDYGTGKNPEHSSNGLTWLMDNWIYSANHLVRYRYDNGKFISEASNFRGQWGVTQDNFGRPYYNSNSTQLRTDSVDAAYYTRNPNLSGKGLNERAAASNVVWPARMNPGVNRGYRKGVLREDGTLSSFTAACGPGVYRGDVFPEWVGDVFICEPAGNLVRRAKVSAKNGGVTSENPYGKSEFIGSLDERFRPVNCYTGPDGALYIVDMYKGIIQHQYYLSPYLIAQSLERGLDKPLNLGRIWRVVPDKGKMSASPPALNKAPTATLVATLSHPNGWRRDTAQRLLVERQDPSAIPALRALATSGKDALGRLHALYTLSGLGDVDVKTLSVALADKDPHVRKAALKCSEPLLQGAKAVEWIPSVYALTKDKDIQVRLQAVFSLGTTAGGKADDVLASLLVNPIDHPLWSDAIIAGLAGREFRMLARICSDPSFATVSAHGKATLKSLASCILTEKKPDNISATLTVAATQSAAGRWRTDAILDGILATKPENAKAGSISLNSPPDSWSLLEQDPQQKERITKITDWIAWPGNRASTHVVATSKLSPEDQILFDAGKIRYQALCAACHQLSGLGLAGLAPPLAASEWVEGPHSRLARIIMHGVSGPMTAGGVAFNGDMPSLGAALDDQAIAEIMAYVGNEWGNNAKLIPLDEITAIRAKESKRGEAWTAQELLKIMELDPNKPN